MPTLKLDGDSSGAVKATNDVGTAAQKLSRDFQQVGLTADQLRQQLQNAYNEKPIDTYIRKCDELSKKLVEGKISAGQYKEQTDRLAEGMKNAGQSHEQAFGSAAIGKVAEMAFAYVSVEKAIEFVTQGLEAMSEQAKEAGERTGEALKGAYQIVQASTNAGEFAANNEQVERLRGLGIDQNQAQAIAGAMAKSGLDRGQQSFIESALHDQRLSAAQTPAFTENVKGFQEAFPKAGSFQEVSRQAMEAARYSRRFSPDEILGLALRAKDEGSELPADQLLATIGQIGRTTPQARRAASAAQKFLKEGESFTGQSATDYAQELSRMQGAGGQADVDFIAGAPQLNAARVAEEATGHRKLAEEGSLGEAERLGRAIYEGRTARAASRGRGARFQEWTSQKMDTRTWQQVIEDEASGREATDDTPGFQNRKRTPFANVDDEEDRNAIKDYLRRQTDIMESEHRSPPPPNGRQE